MVWPMTRHQQKYAARVRQALMTIISQDSALNDQLVSTQGLTITSVRVSPDHSKAFILWDSYKKPPSDTDRVLKHLTPRLKSALSRALGGRSVPRLEFRVDRPRPEDVELERIFATLEGEKEEKV